MTEPWNGWKAKTRLPTRSTAPWKSRKKREIPTFPQLRRRGPFWMRTKANRRNETVGRGKVEIQNQDSHFSTAPISLRRKEENHFTNNKSKSRLHKTLDTAPERSQLLRPNPALWAGAP